MTDTPILTAIARETYSTEGPQCPHCQRQYTADEPHYFDENGYTEETCDQCGKTFEVSVCITTSWTCTPVNAPTTGAK